MTSHVPVASRIRSISWLHRHLQAGSTGRLALPLALIRLALLAAIGIRLWTLTDPWVDLPSADQQPRLWLLMVTSWLSFVVLTALFTLQTVMTRQEVGIMLPLPLDHGTRWRLVLGRVVTSFGIVSLGSGLIIAAALARFGLDWAVTYLAWLPPSMCIGTLLPLFIAWVLNYGRPRTGPVLITLAVLMATGAIAVLALRQSSGHPMPPMLLIPDAVIITTLVVGVGAHRLGRWYVSLAQDLWNAPRRTRDFLGPISPLLRSLLARYRTPWAAIALKELRVQGRDVFVLLRIAITLAALPLFIVTREYLPGWIASSANLPIAYALVLAVYAAIETTPSPLGGEGNRVTLMFLNAASPRDVIVGKAVAVIVPLVAQLWIMVASICIWSGAAPTVLLISTLSATFAVVCIGTILTCLSARDIALDRTVEGSAEALLMEHVPASPRRMANIGIAMAHALVVSTIIITQPWPISLTFVLTGGLLLSVLAYRDAYRRLSQLGAR